MAVTWLSEFCISPSLAMPWVGRSGVFDQIKISVFRVTGLKNLGRVGTYIFF